MESTCKDIIVNMILFLIFCHMENMYDFSDLSEEDITDLLYDFPTEDLIELIETSDDPRIISIARNTLGKNPTNALS